MQLGPVTTRTTATVDTDVYIAAIGTLGGVVVICCFTIFLLLVLSCYHFKHSQFIVTTL